MADAKTALLASAQESYPQAEATAYVGAPAYPQAQAQAYPGATATAQAYPAATATAGASAGAQYGSVQQQQYATYPTDTAGAPVATAEALPVVGDGAELNTFEKTNSLHVRSLVLSIVLWVAFIIFIAAGAAKSAFFSPAAAPSHPYYQYPQHYRYYYQTHPSSSSSCDASSSPFLCGASYLFPILAGLYFLESFVMVCDSCVKCKLGSSTCRYVSNIKSDSSSERFIAGLHREDPQFRMCVERARVRALVVGGSVLIPSVIVAECSTHGQPSSRVASSRAMFAKADAIDCSGMCLRMCLPALVRARVRACAVDVCIAWMCVQLRTRRYVECYHFETRSRQVSFTDGNGNTRYRTEYYQEKVVTHRATGYIQCVVRPFRPLRRLARACLLLGVVFSLFVNLP
jgi:hypothetical protein